jgi:hypothetical protein
LTNDRDSNPLIEDRAEANAKSNVGMVDEAPIERMRSDQPVNTINEPVNTIDEPVSSIDEPVSSTNVRADTGRISGGDEDESSRRKLS